LPALNEFWLFQRFMQAQGRENGGQAFGRNYFKSSRLTKNEQPILAFII
jgi:hypothetical protein